jgi:alanine or glycine:cation symporter, AGCS family
MWLSAFFGMATKMAEAVLGQTFRQWLPDGTVSGGPFHYMRIGLRLPWLAGAFAFFMGGKALFATTTIQSNSVALALQAQFGLPPLAAGIGLAVLVWLVVIGGIHSIARVTSVLSPLMVLLYLAGGLATIALFIDRIPEALQLIVVGAFSPAAVAGGVVGATVAQTMRYGLARGAYSNEAGTGTAAVFHAAARTSEPVRQGLIASLDVFIDTMVVCTITALAVLVTGAWTEGSSTEMTVRAFNTSLPIAGGLVVALSSLLFGFSSLIANPYYGEMAYAYLLGPAIRVPFRWIYCVMILLGSVMRIEAAWSIGDVFNGMMAFTNLIALVALAGVAAAAVKAYLGRIDAAGAP